MVADNKYNHIKWRFEARRMIADFNTFALPILYEWGATRDEIHEHYKRMCKDGGIKRMGVMSESGMIVEIMDPFVRPPLDPTLEIDVDYTTETNHAGGFVSEVQSSAV